MVKPASAVVDGYCLARSIVRIAGVPMTSGEGDEDAANRTGDMSRGPVCGVLFRREGQRHLSASR